MKRRFFCLSFYCFSRRPIYESIAAIFWRSASYVIDVGFFVGSVETDLEIIYTVFPIILVNYF